MNISQNNVADYGRDNQPTSIVIHHTAGNANATHADVLVNFRTWSRRGYHYIIRGNGDIHQSVQEHSMSWGAANQNHNRIHIGLTGNFENHPPTSAQMDSARWLIANIRNRRNISRHNVMTHRQLPGQATLCAGRHLNLNKLIIDGQATPTRVPTPSVTGQVHVVRSGETLNEIARRYQTTVAELVRLNQIGNPNVIRVGQMIRLPNQETIGDPIANTQASHTIRVGARVRVNQTARTWVTGQPIPSWVHGQIYTVQQIRNNNHELLLAGIMSWIRRHDVTLRE